MRGGFHCREGVLMTLLPFGPLVRSWCRVIPILLASACFGLECLRDIEWYICSSLDICELVKCPVLFSFQSFVKFILETQELFACFSSWFSSYDSFILWSIASVFYCCGRGEVTYFERILFLMFSCTDHAFYFVCKSHFQTPGCMTFLLCWCVCDLCA